MALLETILIVVVVVVLIIVIYNVFFNKQNELMSGIEPSFPGIKIDNSRLPENNSSNYSIALWFFIDNWNHRFGHIKSLLQFAPNRVVNLSPTSDSNIPKLTPDNNTFMAAFGAYENDLLIGIKTFGQNSKPLESSDYFSQVNAGTNRQYETFLINNVDIQKWVCLICSIEGRNLDIYLQGKLVRSFILPGVAVSPGTDNIFLGGPKPLTFDGHLARFQFFANSLNPQEAYNIYRDGLGSDMFTNFFDRYRMKIQFMEYDNALGDPIVI